MAPLSQFEKDELFEQVLQKLSHTPYACNELTQLTNGTTNFVFRGTLTQSLPLQDGTKAATVIVKHSTDFAAVNRDLPIDVSRCVFEESMLKALNDYPSTATVVKTPHLFLFDRETNIQVLEDFPGAVDLKTVFVSPNANDILTPPFAESIGHALGSWLHAFHAWSSAPSQAALRKQVGENEPMRKLKYLITYDSFIKVLEQFPDILGSTSGTALDGVKNLAIEEFGKVSGDEPEDYWGIIHGDFWGGNILLPSISLLEAKRHDNIKLFVVDWEFAQFGHRAYDLGQMIGDIYERKHFKDVQGGISAIEGFIKGYGAVEDAVVFRTAIHVGIQLITWCNRGPPHMRPPWATPERIAGIVSLGRDFVVKGWEKDREWLESSVLAGLFGRK